MRIDSVVAGRLSDGRQQVWVTLGDDLLWTQWKSTPDPGAPWSGWHPMPSDAAQQIRA